MKVLPYSPNLIQEIKEEIIKKANLNESNYIISVTGGSATGKTSQVADTLKVLLGNESTILNQDSFQQGKAFVDLLNSEYKWDDPRNFDLGNCLDTLKKLKTNISTEIPNFSVIDVKRIGYKNFDPKKYIIFEGIYACFGDLREVVDYSIYVESRFYARLLRRIFRFTLEMNIPYPEKAVKQCLKGVSKGHKDFVKTQRNVADIIIDMPYTFSETRKKFNLDQINYEMPSGDKVFEFIVEDGVHICAVKNIEKIFFFVEDHEKCKFIAEIDEDVLSILLKTDLAEY